MSYLTRAAPMFFFIDLHWLNDYTAVMLALLGN